MLTINGAVVMPDKKDMVIPQGVAHAVDRVMFPLPVGDLVQTMQSDRESRFNRFLHLIHDTGLESMFTGEWHDRCGWRDDKLTVTLSKV